MAIKKSKDYKIKYTDEYLLDYLRELSIKLGRTPTGKDIKNGGKIKLIIYIRKFEKLRNAQKTAGLVPNLRGGLQTSNKYSNEYLLNYLKELSKKLGRTASSLDVKRDGVVIVSNFINHFGSFRKAQIAAGLVPNRKQCERIYSDEYLLNYLKEISKQLGRTPKVADFVQSGKASAGVYYCRFGGLNNAIKAAGLVPKERIKHKKVTKVTRHKVTGTLS